MNVDSAAQALLAELNAPPVSPPVLGSQSIIDGFLARLARVVTHPDFPALVADYRSGLMSRRDLYQEMDNLLARIERDDSSP